ncbi:anoctamin-5 isoform X2 [Anopheles stephensi]|uniref:anoctamin-5 isoform X2 n=1 Tax=Anopheles stephensi TaxID=30069 RepID=UPI0016589468|nr:anoctamin-5 isoform X2 [Anopheles stephensi]
MSARQRSHSCRDSRASIDASRSSARLCNGGPALMRPRTNSPEDSVAVAVSYYSATKLLPNSIEARDQHFETRNDSSTLDGHTPLTDPAESHRSPNTVLSRMATNKLAEGVEHLNHFPDPDDVGGSFDVLLPNCIVQQGRSYGEESRADRQNPCSRATHSSPAGKPRSRRYSQDSCAPVYERLSVAGFVKNGMISDSCQNIKMAHQQHQALMRHSTDNLRSINNYQGGAITVGELYHNREPVEMATSVGIGTAVGNELTNHGSKTKYFMHRMTAQDLGSGLEPSSSQDSTASPSSTILPKSVETVVDTDPTTTTTTNNGYATAMVNGSVSSASPKDTSFIDKLPPLEDIMESPMLKTPVEKWLQTEDRLSREEGPLPYGPEEPSRSPDLYSNLFGPKISASENIPGTPMDTPDIVSEFNKSFNSSTTSIINERRRSSSKLLGLGGADRNDPVTVGGGTHSSLSDQPIGGTAPGGQSYGGSLGKGSLRNLLKLRKASDQSQDTRRSSQQDKEGLDPESLMFRDGRRKIDMMLCYEEDDQGVMTELEALKRHQRKLFQENLIREGLEFEVEDKAQAFDGKTFFVKIHIPWRTESRYAEVMNLKLPVKRFITISVKEEETALRRQQNRILSYWNRLMSMTEYNHGRIEKEPSFYSATANGNPEEQFIVKDRCTSYTSAQRSLIVMQILMRTRFDETEKVNNVGIRRLLNDGTYLACFPLHEGRYDKDHSSGALFDRRLLYLEWARPIKWYKKQPLCLVRKYFGDKIALYFCWLGFYTKMLYAPAIVGLFCFLYGLASMDSSDNIPTKEICDENGPGKTILCPLCDRACSYQQLHESCFFAQLTYLFDNPSTVFFAIFMSFWATTFLELWKRKQSVLVWEWDLQNIENEEDMRPEFETTVKTFRINPVTREKEPYMPTWTRAVRFVATSSAVLFMISVVLGAVLGTIIYRISLVSVIYSGGGSFFRTHAKLFTTMTAALINLIIIMLLTRIYHKLALYLTNMENPRTQTEYEDSYTVKIFVFEFMNFYSSLIYIAFFKGRFYDYPGDDVARKSEFLRLKGDICDPAGCLSELCIQLAIIMVGKQCWNNFMEYFFPAFYNWWRQRKHKQLTKDETHLHMAWEQDYHLQDPGKLALFDEYLEMIVQYGFVTLFVAAFPLAPLFALLNNIAEIRLDAYKMVTQSRRPLAERVEDIGAWYGILKIITYTAVVSNAFVIAYTSDFIPRMVYKYVYSPQFSLHGYIEHSLSTFNTSDYKEEWGTKTESDPDTCQYRGYRNGPDADEQYGLSPHYWHVFAARLAFVVIFEHIVFVLTGIMQFIIPDIPIEVKTQMQREQLLAKEAKYQHGLKKSRETDYEEILHTLREQSNNSRQGMRGSWARRLSRLSDGLDAHVEVPNRPRHSLESTVWEVT